MTTTDEHVPSDEQVRGRYCDGTYAQTGHTTEGEDFDAWLARVRRDAEAAVLREAAEYMNDDQDAQYLVDCARDIEESP